MQGVGTKGGGVGGTRRGGGAPPNALTGAPPKTAPTALTPHVVVGTAPGLDTTGGNNGDWNKPVEVDKSLVVLSRINLV